MKMSSTSRGMVSVHPGLIALALVLIGLVAWKTIVRVNLIDEVKPFNAAKLRSQTITNGVATPLVCLAIAGGVGAGCYFAFGKSQRAANAGMSVVMVLACGTFSYQMFAYLTRDTKAAPVAVGTRSSESGTGSGGTSAGSGSTPYVVPRPAAPTSQPFNATPSPAGVTQPSGGSPASVAPAMPVAPPPPPAPAFNGKPVLDTLRLEYAAKCEVLAVKAEAAFAAAAQPKKANQFLNEWIEKFNTLKAEAEALEAEIRELSMRGAREALEKAGAPLGDAASQAMGFGEQFGTFERQVACGEVSRFAERGAELFTIIKENIAKVQIDSKGEATSKDREVETKLFHARTHLKFAVEKKDETLKKVRGKE